MGLEGLSPACGKIAPREAPGQAVCTGRETEHPTPVPLETDAPAPLETDSRRQRFPAIDRNVGPASGSLPGLTCRCNGRLDAPQTLSVSSTCGCGMPAPSLHQSPALCS